MLQYFDYMNLQILYHCIVVLISTRDKIKIETLHYQLCTSSKKLINQPI